MAARPVFDRRGFALAGSANLAAMVAGSSSSGGSASAAGAGFSSGGAPSSRAGGLLSVCRAIAANSMSVVFLADSSAAAASIGAKAGSISGASAGASGSAAASLAAAESQCFARQAIDDAGIAIGGRGDGFDRLRGKGVALGPFGGIQLVVNEGRHLIGIEMVERQLGDDGRLQEAQRRRVDALVEGARRQQQDRKEMGVIDLGEAIELVEDLVVERVGIVDEEKPGHAFARFKHQMRDKRPEIAAFLIGGEAELLAVIPHQRIETRSRRAAHQRRAMPRLPLAIEAGHQKLAIRRRITSDQHDARGRRNAPADRGGKSPIVEIGREIAETRRVVGEWLLRRQKALDDHYLNTPHQNSATRPCLSAILTKPAAT